MSTYAIIVRTRGKAIIGMALRAIKKTLTYIVLGHLRMWTTLFVQVLSLTTREPMVQNN